MKHSNNHESNSSFKDNPKPFLLKCWLDVSPQPPVAQPLARHHTDPLQDMIGRWSRGGIPKWYPILDLIPEAEPVHFGGHALLQWEELAQKAVHWEENVRWVGWSFADKLELMWMCKGC